MIVPTDQHHQLYVGPVMGKHAFQFVLCLARIMLMLIHAEPLSWADKERYLNILMRFFLFIKTLPSKSDTAFCKQATLSFEKE